MLPPSATLPPFQASYPGLPPLHPLPNPQLTPLRGPPSFHSSVTGTGCVLVCLAFFVAACRSDPGTVRREDLAAWAALYPLDGVLFPAKHCATCGMQRPARAKHCGVCGRWGPCAGIRRITLACSGWKGE